MGLDDGVAMALRIEKYDGSLSTLYALWLTAAREWPLEPRMTEKQFFDKYLKNPLAEKVLCFVAFRENEAVGAILMECISVRRMATLQLWVPSDAQKEEIGSLLLEKGMSGMKTMPGIQMAYSQTIPFCPSNSAFFKARGFHPHPEFPSGFLMRREMNGIPRSVEMPTDFRVQRVEEIERFDKTDQMAELDQMEARSAGNEFKIEALIEDIKAQAGGSIEYCYSVGILNDRVVGYTLNSLLQNASGELQLKNRGLIISSGHRNKGIGRILLEDGLRWGREKGAKVAYISTHSKNPARFLYEKVGYEIVETIEILVNEVGN